MATTDTYQRIFAKIIIPGRGDPIYHGVVVIKNDIIDYVGTAQEYQQHPSYSQKISKEFTVPLLMPGLWDCHAHFVCIMSCIIIIQLQFKYH